MQLSHSFTVLGVALISVSGWLGGEMVYVGGVGVTASARNSPKGPLAG
jgi:uncharacterized membrane protein